MSILAVFIPFDLFGSSGTAAGAELLADALREMQNDNRAERRATRARSYQDRLRSRELTFETLEDVNRWEEDARHLARKALEQRQFLLWIGGNHLTVLPVLEELGRGGDSVCLQLDAHLDVYHLTECTRHRSHGNFLRYARGKLPELIHLGNRDLFLPNREIARHFHRAFSAVDWATRANEILEWLKQETTTAGRLWIDLDCDVLDPAFFPAVDGPLPMGLTPQDLIRVLQAVWGQHIAGVSISEFSPGRDRQDQSLGLLIWLMEWLLLRHTEGDR
ncbi:MAG: arginase family protein [Gemmataceae bacterium]|nr:arginase family protein [Gemmataceae bacterium]